MVDESLIERLALPAPSIEWVLAGRVWLFYAMALERRARSGTP